MVERHTQADTKKNNETAFWAMYPMNVHHATTGNKSSAFSLQTKRTVAVFVFIGLTVFLTALGFYLGNKYNVGLLSAVVSFLASIILSIFLYTRLLRDKFNEEFESDTKNKIMKLFRVRLNDNDRDTKINGVDLMSYTSGEVFVTLRLEIGNSNAATSTVTAEFLDKVLRASHQLQLVPKNYNIRSKWKKSDVHHAHLKRISKIQDQKLKSTLVDIDIHQSKIFEQSKVLGIHLVFVTRKNNLYGLESIIQLVNDWKEEYIYTSSIRSLEWLDKENTIEALCDFLTIDMLDVTSNLNKKTVKYDIRKMVKVFSRNRFNPAKDIKIESKAALLRKSRGK